MKYSKEYWRGYHDCENGKKLKINETEDWRLGFLTALEDGADHQRKEVKANEKKNQNRKLWCGFRPSVISTKKKNKKNERKEGSRFAATL